MNIDSPTLNKPIQTTEMQQASVSSNAQSSTLTEDTKSFKDELGALGAAKQNINEKTNTVKSETKTQDSKNTKSSSGDKVSKESKTDKTDKSDKASNAVITDKAITSDNTQTTAEAANQNNQTQTDKKQFGESGNSQKNSNDKQDLLSTSKVENPALLPLYELNAKIETITDLKSNSNSKIEKSSDKFGADKVIDFKTIKMDNNDALFFANLIKNGTEKADMSEIKAEATQKSSQVSSVLMDALTDSMKTNKPFRIDFDKDIAVIMKVDKDGKLSADFIPGDKAVENYLRNNIPLLKQSFDEQNIQYNQLSYRKQEQQKQQQQNNQKNKENEDE